MVGQKSWEGIHRDEPPSADPDVARLRLQFRHKPLEELVEDGLLTYGEDHEMVKKGLHFDSARPLR